MDYKFSGHETFAFRYAWLPKAYRAVVSDATVFSDDDRAMIELGVGKNMVRSIRFWASMLGIIESDGRGTSKPTSFGKKLLDPKVGLDPYLEDSQTLWLLHWRLSTASEPLFVWHYLLNRWQESEMVSAIILPMIARELEGIHAVSLNSINSMLNVFFHTYVPTRGKKNKVMEDNLDCPLVQLKLVEYAGEQDTLTGRKEAIYAFRRDEKPEISHELFQYCLADYWGKKAPKERTLSYGQLSSEAGCPGQVFKISDEGMLERLVDMGSGNKYFTFTDSSTSRSLERKFDSFERVSGELLKGIYR